MCNNKSIVTVVLNNFVNDSRVLKESASLKKAGYDITIVAVHTEGLPEKEVIQDIPIHRLYLKTRRLPKKNILQFFKYLEFTFKFYKGYKHANIIHCNDLETLPIGVFIKLFLNRNIKIVYDAHEFETEQKPQQKIIIKKLLSIIEKYLIKFTDKVITVSNSIANEYVTRYHIQKPALVLNCPIKTNVTHSDIFRQKYNLSDEVNIFLYQGGLVQHRGVNKLLEAFKTIYNETKDRKNVIVFMGDGPLEEKIKSIALKYSTVFFHPAVPPELTIKYTASADFGLLFYENDCLNHFYCLPNKFFEYLMAGLPVITSNLYETRKIIEKYKIGLVAKENTTEEILNLIHDIDKFDIDTMRNNIKKISEIYNWGKQEKILLELYKKL